MSAVSQFLEMLKDGRWKSSDSGGEILATEVTPSWILDQDSLAQPLAILQATPLAPSREAELPMSPDAARPV